MEQVDGDQADMVLVGVLAEQLEHVSEATLRRVIGSALDLAARRAQAVDHLWMVVGGRSEDDGECTPDLQAIFSFVMEIVSRAHTMFTGTSANALRWPANEDSLEGLVPAKHVDFHPYVANLVNNLAAVNGGKAQHRTNVMKKLATVPTWWPLSKEKYAGRFQLLPMPELLKVVAALLNHIRGDPKTIHELRKGLLKRFTENAGPLANAVGVPAALTFLLTKLEADAPGPVDPGQGDVLGAARLGPVVHPGGAGGVSVRPGGSRHAFRNPPPGDSDDETETAPLKRKRHGVVWAVSGARPLIGIGENSGGHSPGKTSPTFGGASGISSAGLGAEAGENRHLPVADRHELSPSGIDRHQLSPETQRASLLEDTYSADLDLEEMGVFAGENGYVHVPSDMFFALMSLQQQTVGAANGTLGRPRRPAADEADFWVSANGALGSRGTLSGPREPAADEERDLIPAGGPGGFADGTVLPSGTLGRPQGPAAYVARALALADGASADGALVHTGAVSRPREETIDERCDRALAAAEKHLEKEAGFALADSVLRTAPLAADDMLPDADVDMLDGAQREADGLPVQTGQLPAPEPRFNTLGPTQNAQVNPPFPGIALQELPFCVRPPSRQGPLRYEPRSPTPDEEYDTGSEENEHAGAEDLALPLGPLPLGLIPVAEPDSDLGNQRVEHEGARAFRRLEARRFRDSEVRVPDLGVLASVEDVANQFAVVENPIPEEREEADRPVNPVVLRHKANHRVFASPPSFSNATRAPATGAPAKSPLRSPLKQPPIGKWLPNLPWALAGPLRQEAQVSTPVTIPPKTATIHSGPAAIGSPKPEQHAGIPRSAVSGPQLGGLEESATGPAAQLDGVCERFPVFRPADVTAEPELIPRAPKRGLRARIASAVSGPRRAGGENGRSSIPLASEDRNANERNGGVGVNEHSRIPLASGDRNAIERNKQAGVNEHSRIPLASAVRNPSERNGRVGVNVPPEQAAAALLSQLEAGSLRSGPFYTGPLGEARSPSKRPDGLPQQATDVRLVVRGRLKGARWTFDVEKVEALDASEAADGPDAATETHGGSDGAAILKEDDSDKEAESADAGAPGAPKRAAAPDTGLEFLEEKLVALSIDQGAAQTAHPSAGSQAAFSRAVLPAPGAVSAVDPNSSGASDGADVLPLVTQSSGPKNDAREHKFSAVALEGGDSLPALSEPPSSAFRPTKTDAGQRKASGPPDTGKLPKLDKAAHLSFNTWQPERSPDTRPAADRPMRTDESPDTPGSEDSSSDMGSLDSLSSLDRQDSPDSVLPSNCKVSFEFPVRKVSPEERRSVEAAEGVWARAQ